jgi:ferric-dicitrate binding protein FerR (iron transport regulator)
LVGSVLWWDPAHRHEHFATAIGERRNIDLSDGSQIVLDTDSQVDVSWHLRSRRATLISGRALFEVEAAARPFHVDAGEIEIRVVGTRFDVNRSGDAIAVIVARGKVAVHARGNERLETLLLPGQQLVANGGHLGMPDSVDAALGTAWTSGQLLFDRTPLGEVVARIQRYRNALLVLDPALADLQVSGVFSADRTDEILELLPQILPVEVVRATDGGASIKAR